MVETDRPLKSERSASHLVVVLALWGVSVVILVLGGVVGFGASARDAVSVSVLAIAAGVGAVAVLLSLLDPAARIGMGLALTLQAFAITGATFSPEFQFIWPSTDFRLTLFVLLIAVVALWLLAILVDGTRSEYSRSSSSSWSHESGVRVRSSEISSEVWVVTWAMFAVIAALMGHELAGIWGQGPWGMIGGVLVVAVAHQVTWWITQIGKPRD